MGRSADKIMFFLWVVDDMAVLELFEALLLVMACCWMISKLLLLLFGDDGDADDAVPIDTIRYDEIRFVPLLFA